MRLPQPFYCLPVRFDAERLRAEVAALPPTAWNEHPNEIAGNSSVRLISVEGGENDEVDGRMDLTVHLRQSPYIRQILSTFGVVWSRSRLMRLAPGASVPQHADINYHWFTRVRLHIPIITRPSVRFYCGDQDVHMAAGEAWLFDNWRLHRVENPADHERIHLVADTSGSSSFWQFVARSQSPGTVDQAHRYDPKLDVTPLTEKAVLAPLMAPAEVDLLILDLRSELATQADTPELASRLAHYHAMLDSFCKDWRQLYLLHDGAADLTEFTKLRDGVRTASMNLGDGLIMRTNRVAANLVLEGRVLRPLLSVRTSRPPTRLPRTLQRPVFIVSAPRSGSTLLFETLAASEQLVTLGGEAHWLVESMAELQPGAPGVVSNRLTADHCTAAIAERIRAMIADCARDHAGRPTSLEGRRFLEKTPKNSLRIPFFNEMFPDAQFIFLWRDPRENLSSIIEAWRSGNWKTYGGLDGFRGPWSLLLPPGWKGLDGRPLEEIAAFQWDTTNRIVLDDLGSLPRERWAALSYAELVDTPEAAVERLCRFIGIGVDASLRARLAAPLPLSLFTQTPPAPDKWKMNEALIDSVLAQVDETWQRLKALR